MNFTNTLNEFKQNVKRNQSFGLYVKLGFIISGYMFFLIASFLMPNTSRVDALAKNEALKLQDGREISIIRNDYSEAQGLLQYEFAVDNTLVKPYKFEIKYRAKNTNAVEQVEVEVVMEDAEICIINAKNLPNNWNEILVNVIGDNEGEIIKVGSLYSDRDSVDFVDNISIKSANEYRIDRAKHNIAKYNSAVEELSNKNNSLWYEIGLLQNLNKKLEDRKANETEQEIAVTNANIAKNDTQIQTYYNDIIQNDEMIKEYGERITKQNELLKELSK